MEYLPSSHISNLKSVAMNAVFDGGKNSMVILEPSGRSISSNRVFVVPSCR